MRIGGRAVALAMAAVVALAACGDSRKHVGKARTEPGSGGDGQAAPDAGAVAAPTGRDAGPDPTDVTAPPPATDDDVDDGAAALGAIPAWQAVVDRDRYLARRNQKTVIYGRLGGEAIAPGARGSVRWLIDELEGDGALAVRVAIAGQAPAEGARVAVRGAWTTDDQRHWYWQVESLSSLDTPAPAAPPDPPAPPGHDPRSAPAPAGYRGASRAKDDGVIVFGVIRSPPTEGDGWLVGDDSFGAPAALLFLPGERPSYGGHDLRQPDEHWQLKRGVFYWVRVGKVRRRSPDDLPLMHAVTAPAKVQ